MPVSDNLKNLSSEPVVSAECPCCSKIVECRFDDVAREWFFTSHDEAVGTFCNESYMRVTTSMRREASRG